MSMSSSLAPETEIQSMDAGPPSKRAKTAAALRKQLVVCFMQVSPTRYEIMFYSTQELLFASPQSPLSVSSIYDHDETPLLHPERSLGWYAPPRRWRSGLRLNRVCDDDDQGGGGPETEPYYSMSFLHSSRLENDQLFVVGGCKPTVRGFPFDCSPLDLPNEFISIPLSEEDGNKACVKVSRQTPMIKGKSLPLIVEIGGCIYVLSAPFPVETAFEVYEVSGWKSLPAPPFIGASDYSSPYNITHRYSYIVFEDRKLFVSDGICSCVFDTCTGAWEKCDLFSECFQNMKLPHLKHLSDKTPDGCGPGFPFQKQAIMWKDGIFLCLIPGQYPPVAAFHIISDDSGREKAVQVPLCFDDTFIWYGRFDHLVDLGGDYVAVLLYEKEFEDCFMTILTFKLNKSNGGIVSCELKSERHCRGHRFVYPAYYCFTL